MPVRRRVHHRRTMSAMGRRRKHHRGGSFLSKLKSVGKAALPYALDIGKKYVLPKALEYGKSHLKKRFPWLSHLGLGRRRRHRSVGMGRRGRTMSVGMGHRRRRHHSMPVGMGHRKRHRGAGFWSDFGNGFLKGFTTVTGPFAKAALGKVLGSGRRHHRLTGSRRATALRNLAKARAAKKAMHGGMFRNMGVLHGGRHRKHKSHRGGMFRNMGVLHGGAHKGVRVSSGLPIPIDTTLGHGRRRSVHRGGNFLDDFLGTVGKISETVAPIAVGALGKRFGLGRRRHHRGIGLRPPGTLPRGYGHRRHHRKHHGLGLHLPGV